MYCRFCGTEISNQSRFCSSCGSPQNPVKKSSTNIWPMVLCYTIGIFFILGGILPYLLQRDLAEYNTYLSLLYAKLSSPEEIAAISCFTKFASSLSPLFYFSSSVLAVYVGLLLFKRKSKPAVPIIICAIVHVVSMIYSGIVNLLIYVAPQLVLSFYTSEASVIAAGRNMIMSEPGMLYYYQDNAICRSIISVILIALAIIFLFIKLRYKNNATNNIFRASSIGGVIMILSVSVLAVVSTALSTSLDVYFYGDYAVAANSVANLSFNLNIRFTAVFMFIIIISIAVLFTRIKRWILAIPAISILAILGFVAFLFSRVLIENLDTPAEIFYIASNKFRGLIVSCAAMLIAMFYWFSSVSRNTLPTWVQIALPLSLPFIYIGIEIIVNAILHLNSGISFGIVGVALTTVLVSLLIGPKKNSFKLN